MTTWSDDHLRAIADIVSAHTGLSFPANRIAAAEGGIRRAMACEGITDVAQYRARVLSDPRCVDRLMTELTIGETYFFRQRAHFDLITTRVLPEVQQRRGVRHAVRVWSAGCASGEEAYSVAMTLADAGVAGHVLATDVCKTALARGQAGEYRRWSLRGLAPDEIVRVLHQRGDRWVIDDRYRRLVSFAYHNLASDRYPPKPGVHPDFDVIFCRNVLIYLDDRTIAHVTAGLVASLADEGWLLTGPHDPPLVHPELTASTVGELVVYRREVHKTRAEVSAAIPQVVDCTDAGQSAARRAGAAPASPDTIAAFPLARAAFLDGRYEDALTLAGAPGDESVAIFRVHVIANAQGSSAALVEVDRQLDRYALSASLHLLRALMLVDLRRIDDATVSLRRTLYLDPSSAIATAMWGHLHLPAVSLAGYASARLTQTDRDAIGPGEALSA
jgi:chemotaxis protein methyltransferase CheR